ncbi:MAG: hypothetical protein HYX61_02935 [Gammaproteobacteria bacterium]|nr:hypothetical protein [Gammaproteobacteria bacterium]
MRKISKYELARISGGNIDIQYSKNEVIISLDRQDETVLFNGIGFGWNGWSKGGYNHLNTVITENEYNGYKIAYYAGNSVTFRLTPLK